MNCTSFELEKVIVEQKQLKRPNYCCENSRNVYPHNGGGKEDSVTNNNKASIGEG